jgi:acetate kinase
MRILVINCGSSSIKYQVFDMHLAGKVLARGLVERIGIDGGVLKQTASNGAVVTLQGVVPDHTFGIRLLLDALTSGENPVLECLSEIDAVGHRVVHGGELFTQSVVVDEPVKNQIKACSDLAPLHNPSNLKGIMAMEVLLPGVKQVAVFDTSFHQTMPNYAYLYGIPYKYYEEYKIRRYGFHGISHQYVAKRACELTGKNLRQSKIITCHLGNGASITAVENGKSVDTSMGFTPVSGLMMGTRCGTIDPGILLYLEEKHHLSIKGITNLINKESGLQGISGISSDMRDIQNAADEGYARAILAFEMYTYRIRKWIGSFAGVMDGADMIVFTGGIGENSFKVRESVCSKLHYLGARLDAFKNMEAAGQDAVISTLDSDVSLVVAKTDEELVIATETLRLIEALNPVQ